MNNMGICVALSELSMGCSVNQRLLGSCRYLKMQKKACPLTQCILVDSSTVILWMSPFVILRVLDLFCQFYFFFLLENPVSKQWRP